MKKIITVVCAVVLAFGFTGCKKDDNGIYIDDGSRTISDDCTVVDGEYIVRHKKSDYVIVTENAPDEYIDTAAQDFNLFFNEATGVSLSVKQDKETTGKEKKIISVGSTSYARLALGSTGSELGNGSYRVAAKDGGLYVLGGSTAGTLLGVYKLLNYMFGYEFYKDGVYEIAHDVNDLNYFTVDKTQKAAIPMRADYSGMNLYGSTMASKRLGLMTDEKITVFSHHNSLVLLNSETYGAEHPKWYSTGGDQLCFTARGDENELDEMIETLSDKFAAELMKEENRNKKYVRFSMMDNKNWCACEACNAAAEKYNAVSGALLTVCNRMGKRTTEKLAAEGDDRTIKIVTLLYNKTEDVPVATTDGGYEKNENIGALDYVTPQWACMTMKNHAKAWAAEENNAARDMLERMNAVFEEFWVWDYGTNFNDYLLPFDTFNSMAEDMKLLGNYNIGLYLYQLANSAHNVSGFNSLKLYLLSKLMVDPSLDIDELTDDYFAHAYGKGGNAMRKIYDEYRLVALYNSEDHGDFTAWNQSIYSQTMLSADYWKRGTVKRWLALLDEALEESGNDGTLNAGTLKANSDGEYERNIMVDGVFVRYIYAVLYLQDEYADNIAFKLKLYNDVGALGFNHVKEQSDATANLWPLREALGIGNYL